MKEEILETISMQDIIDKYGIENNGKMFSCPFHGVDRHPSAKIYTNSFYCYTCNVGGDTIRFVEKLFNLPFKDAMQKINFDFNMGLSSDYVDYNRLKQLKNIQNEKKKKKEKLVKGYSELCDLKHYYEKIINHFSKRINIKNWEISTHTISYFQEKIEKINQDLIDIDNILSSRI